MEHWILENKIQCKKGQIRPEHRIECKGKANCACCVWTRSILEILIRGPKSVIGVVQSNSLNIKIDNKDIERARTNSSSQQ